MSKLENGEHHVRMCDKCVGANIFYIASKSLFRAHRTQDIESEILTLEVIPENSWMNLVVPGRIFIGKNSPGGNLVAQP
jgi:hypothetical protein